MSGVMLDVTTAGFSQSFRSRRPRERRRQKVLEPQPDIIRNGIGTDNGKSERCENEVRGGRDIPVRLGERSVEIEENGVADARGVNREQMRSRRDERAIHQLKTRRAAKARRSMSIVLEKSWRFHRFR